MLLFVLSKMWYLCCVLRLIRSSSDLCVEAFECAVSVREEAEAVVAVISVCGRVWWW